MNNENLIKHLLAVADKKAIGHDAEMEKRAAENKRKDIESFCKAIERDFGLPYMPNLSEPEIVIDEQTGLRIGVSKTVGRNTLVFRIECPKCGGNVESHGVAVHRIPREIAAFRQWFKEIKIRESLDDSIEMPPWPIPDVKHLDWKYHKCFLKSTVVPPADNWRDQLIDKLVDVVDTAVEIANEQRHDARSDM